MRHRMRTDTLSRFTSFRKATLKSMAISVFVRQKIITTKAKAKTARRFIENIITIAKKDSLASRRRVFSLLSDHKLVKLLFEQVAPKFKEINGGYTRIIPFRRRKGDNAELVVLELTKTYEVAHKEKKIKEKKEQKPAVEPKKQEKEHIKEDKPVEHKAEVKEEKEVIKEKPHAHPEEEKHKKPEGKKPKGLFGGFKGFFKRERDSL